MFEVVTATYKQARPDLDPTVVEDVIRAAIARAQQKHEDWDHFAPAIDFLSSSFFTDHTRMPIDDYLETLYCAVKHGDFSKKWREMLRGARAAAAGDGKPQ